MYNKIAERYNELYGDEQIEKLKEIGKYINVKPEFLLLDVGCGTGISTNYFKCQTIGIDNCEEMINQGKGNLILGTYEKLQFRNKKFDIIICVTAIHHFTKLEKFIKEIKKVAKPKAQIVITVLKKSHKQEYIRRKLEENFLVTKEINEKKDYILILKNI